MDANLLISELAAGGQIIKTLVEGFTQAEAQARPDALAWSALEVVCHLYDEEREDFRQRIDYTLHKPGVEWPPIDPGGWVDPAALQRAIYRRSAGGFSGRAGALAHVAEEPAKPGLGGKPHDIVWVHESRRSAGCLGSARQPAHPATCGA